MDNRVFRGAWHLFIESDVPKKEKKYLRVASEVN